MPTPFGAAQDPGEFAPTSRLRGLLVQRLTTGKLRLLWSSSTCPGGENAGIYQGTLGVWYHAAIVCSDLFPYLQEDVSMPSYNAYFLVVPHNAINEEGSYGTSTLGGVGQQRPRGTVVCESNQILSCTP